MADTANTADTVVMKNGRVEQFRDRMKDKNNRRLARFAMSKNQGWWRNYTSLPYYMKYKVYKDKNGKPEYTVDQITDKYEQLVNSAEHDADAKKTLELVDNIFTPQRKFMTYFSGSVVAVIIIITLFVIMFLCMFEVIPQPSKTITILCGVSIGLLLALPLFKVIGCDLYPFIAWYNTKWT